MKIATFALGLFLGVAVGKWGCASSAQADRVHDIKEIRKEGGDAIKQGGKTYDEMRKELDGSSGRRDMKV